MTFASLTLQPEKFSNRILLLIVFVGFSLLAFANVQRWLAQAQDIALAEQSTQNLARALAQHVEGSFAQTDLILSGAVLLVEKLATSSNMLSKLEQLFILRTQESSMLQNLIFIDERGQRRLAIRTAKNQTTDNSDRDYFKWHRDHADRQSFIGKPIKTRSADIWVLTVSRRINKADGSFGGVLLASIDLNFFKQFYAQFNIGERGLILLAYADGTIVVRRPLVESAIGTKVNGSPFFTFIMTAKAEGNFQGLSVLDGVERIFGFQRLTKYPLLVSVGFDRKDVLAGWWDRTLKVNLILIANLLILCFLAWRLRQQQILRARSQSLLKQVTDNLPLLIIFIDKQQRYRFVNQSYARAYRKPVEEMIGMRVEDLIGKATYAVVQPHLEAALAGELNELDLQSTKIEPKRDLRAQFLPQQDARGVVEGTIVIITDITEDKAREVLLKKANVSLARAQSQAHVGNWEYDFASGVITWSDELFRILGLTPGAVRPDLKQVSAVFHPDDHARCMATYAEAIANQTSCRMAFRIIRPDGSVRHLVDSLAVLFDAAGQPESLFGSLIDVTESVLAELAVKAFAERELLIGYGIQQSLLMADVPAKLNGAWISTLIEPSQGLHGDFVAVSQHSPACFNLLVGDVMGKGIHAAMIGAGIKNTYYQVLAEMMASAITTGHIPGPACLINALHTRMTPQLINMKCFVTLALYAFDAEAGTICYVNAGHTPALLTRHDDLHVAQLEGDNLPLGVLSDEIYVEHVVASKAEDQLVVYSDGISETRDQQGNELGVTGIARWLSLCNRAELPDAVALQILRRDLAQSLKSDRLTDDQTVMMVRSRPAANPMQQGADHGTQLEMFSLPMRLDALPALRKWLIKVSTTWTTAQSEALLLAVFESATNAIRHTTASLVDASLNLRLTRDASSIVIELFYLGKPVVINTRREPDFSGISDGGFGLYIIASLLDTVSYDSPLPGLVRMRMQMQVA